jgi:hypothetical protein
MPRVYKRDLHEDGCKTCPRCNIRKSIIKFGYSAKAWDGLRGYCLDCEMEKRSDPAHKENERIRQRGERYRKSVNKRGESPEVRAKKAELKKALVRSGKADIARELDKQRHPSHYAARRAVRDAVNRGKLAKPSKCACQMAGDGKCTASIHYHHHLGYEEIHWLNVIPVCSYHHGVLHRKFRDANSASGRP